MELPALYSHRAQGLALTHVLEQNLKPVAGLRPEAAKLVILVTDGKSQDDAGTAGRMLKGLGVDVFAVGEQPPGSQGQSSQRVAPTPPALPPGLQVLWPLSPARCLRVGRTSPCSRQPREPAWAARPRSNEVSVDVSVAPPVCTGPVRGPEALLCSLNWPVINSVPWEGNSRLGGRDSGKQRPSSVPDPSPGVCRMPRKAH